MYVPLSQLEIHILEIHNMTKVYFFFLFITLFMGLSAFKTNQLHGVIRNGFTLQMVGFGTSVPKISTKAVKESDLCACKSKLTYIKCCKPFHDGDSIPETPIEVVRSRFSALSYNLPDYLIATTHPENKEFVSEDRLSKRKQWIKSLIAFSDEYEFEDLIFSEEEATTIDEGKAEISFIARLKKSGTDRAENVKEKSVFAKVGGKWLYLDADIKNPFKNKVDATAVRGQLRMVSTAKRGVSKTN